MKIKVGLAVGGPWGRSLLHLFDPHYQFNLLDKFELSWVLTDNPVDMDNASGRYWKVLKCKDDPLATIDDWTCEVPEFVKNKLQLSSDNYVETPFVTKSGQVFDDVGWFKRKPVDCVLASGVRLIFSWEVIHKLRGNFFVVHNGGVKYDPTAPLGNSVFGIDEVGNCTIANKAFVGKDVPGEIVRCLLDKEIDGVAQYLVEGWRPPDTGRVLATSPTIYPSVRYRPLEMGCNESMKRAIQTRRLYESVTAMAPLALEISRLALRYYMTKDFDLRPEEQKLFLVSPESLRDPERIETARQKANIQTERKSRTAIERLTT